VILLVSGLFFSAFFYRLKQQKFKTNALAMEMKALRSQMNPHFVFNSLASIQSFILKGNINDSNRYLTKFSKLIRGVLESSKNELVTLKKELDLLNIYIELEQLRVKPFEYRLKLDQSIDPQNIKVPPMIFQPFIENAIWHGLEPAAKKGVLLVELYLEENGLFCVIEDNGVGRKYAENKFGIVHASQRSYGIEITAERISALKKTYHTATGTEIVDLKDEENNPAGTRIEILLPIIYNEHTSDHH
jgi:LytS/YehU family sensor histidine kinase